MFAKFANSANLKISKISEKFRKIWQNSSNFLKKCDFRAVQRSALCRSRRELSNAYLLAKFGFDTAENEPSKVCRIRERRRRGRAGGRGAEGGSPADRRPDPTMARTTNSSSKVTG